MRRLFTLALVMALSLATLAGTSAGMPGGGSPSGENKGRGHEKRQPKIVRKWQAEKAAAADLVAMGEARIRSDGTVRLANGQFTDYQLQGEDHIVTLLVEFTDPVHNQIAEPDRALDNSTYWIDDFSRDHYEDMMFSDGGASYGFPSMRDYYRQVSSGRYAVTGQVSNWLQVPHPESEFGANSSLGDGSDDANGPVFRVVDASVDAAAAAGTGSGIDWSPGLVDVYDRYDCDGDGNFNEADGYLDHLTIIHAGEGEEGGGGAQGGDAIWSHRWYANFGDIGTAGPAGCLLGGYEVPGTGLWAGDYTIEPENGGVGVLAHEFGHDLGLPDLYDTTGPNDNSVSFWSIMSDGGWPSDDPDTLDTKPVHMGPWEKLVLGWLDGDLETLSLGQDKRVKLGPAEGRTAGAAQAIRVNLPDYQKTETVFAPEGTDPNYYYSGQGNDLDNSMTRTSGRRGDLVPRELRHRARLGLRVPRGIHERGHDVRLGRHLPVHGHQPERPELRERHHGDLGRMGDGNGDPAGRNHAYPVPVLDRRRGRRPGLRGRLDPGRWRPGGRRDEPECVDVRRVQPGRERSGDQDVLPLLPDRVAQLRPQRHEPLRCIPVPEGQLPREAVLRERRPDLVPELGLRGQRRLPSPGRWPDPRG